MKITAEERMLLVIFSGFVAAALGLPRETQKRVMIYIVDRFVKKFDETPEAFRAEIASAVAKDREELRRG